MRLPKDRLSCEYSIKIYAFTKNDFLKFTVGALSSFYSYLWFRDSVSVLPWYWTV